MAAKGTTLTMRLPAPAVILAGARNPSRTATLQLTLPSPQAHLTGVRNSQNLPYTGWSCVGCLANLYLGATGTRLFTAVVMYEGSSYCLEHFLPFMHQRYAVQQMPGLS